MNLELPATGEKTVDMLEWLVWRWDLRRQRRVCECRGHDITGPHLTFGGWYIYSCTRCPYRFRADRTREGCNDAAGSKVAQVRTGLDLPDQSQSNSVREAND